MQTVWRGGSNQHSGDSMTEPGPLLASGRDADIFEYGSGLVLRRTRTGRSLEAEARVMAGGPRSRWSHFFRDIDKNQLIVVEAPPT